MKKTLLIMVMALAVLLTQCRKPEVKFPSPVAPEGTTVSMTVTAGPGSKTDITTAGGITWSTGDKLYVGYDSKYVGYLTIVSGQNTPTGTFSGDVTLPTGTENGEKTFHFFYLGSAERTLEVGATTVDVDFSSQNIYNNGGNLENAGAQHVGYGSAKGTVAGSEVTGINVTLVSKVALASFSFKKGGADYTGALTLSGDHIYSSMTVGFNGEFNGKDKGSISLTGSHSERYVMLVPPADVAAETLNFDGGAGTTILENGIEANKFYGKNEAIPVTVNAYVDLGLSVKWATCNLGAEHPYDYGNYYAWGETAGYNEKMDGEGAKAGASYNPGTVKTSCSWDYYKWGSGKNSLGKYVNMTGYGMDTPDNLITLLSEDDAATKNWGSDWRMPTEAEFKELVKNTTRTWYAEDNTEFNGVAGWKCFSKMTGYTDNYIFLPAAGYREKTWECNFGSSGYYWSSTLSEYYPYCGRDLWFSKREFRTEGWNREYGVPVRPVSPPQN